ncbi:MAG: indolepyruvate ferredoxin oxidoreductase family protein [Candidatus Latescibacteria bacterium]|nr:indolepyruvate ferredoxin oxidoreductase family protein [Candidatus Latescibacterota bacterium]
MTLSIADKYQKEEGQVFLTGIEAIVRLILEKQRRDEAAGPVNQTYITGYEGSPLGGLDLKVVEQLELLNQRGRTVHQFGVNEKTAASAMLGTQYGPDGDVDAFWYGKAHGTMWIPDEVWLANLAGSSGRGSMVLLSGEDHRSKSSVSPGAADWVLRSSWVPVFYPASVEEILFLGLHAVALSRYLGVVTSLKLVTPVCDGASTVDLAAARPRIDYPEVYEKRFNRIVMATNALPMQRELIEDKWPLVEAYLRANGINRIVDAEVGGDIGIVATGKSYTDVRQALDALGLRVPVLHVRVPYPLDTEIVRQFGRGLRTVYVVEEPGPFVEEGIKAALWNTGVEAVYGHTDESGNPFIPAHGEVDPEFLASVLAPRLGGSRTALLEELAAIQQREAVPVPSVSPMSCGGCPYNSFRDLNEKPGGAIGCSSIRATPAYDNGVLYIPTMGAGGSIYSGWAQFNGNQHIFQYLGDGSYFHSGRGAVQSCVQSQVNITFLLLYNGAVALTGGQQPAGQRPIGDVAQELRGLGVGTIGIVSEDPGRYKGLGLSQVEIYGLERHSQALQHFAQLAGTTVLILDKECATEKGRRQRRAGIQPQRYILIDEEVCEGCGDCYEQSEGCAALYSVATDLGPKTQVRQGNCAQDELCVDGECPSFVSVIPAPGTQLRRRRPTALEQLPEPPACTPGQRYTIYAVGRGGTGVVTISHLLAYAAIMEGRYVYLSNNTGLAQKGGPVEAPIVLSDSAQPVFNRLFPGQADLYLGFDLIRAAEAHNLQYAHPERSLALVSSALVPTAAMNRNPTGPQPESERLQAAIDQCSRKSDNVYLDTYWVAERLFGDILYANMLLLGAAYQAGGIPLRAASIETAIELNGKAVEANIQAFRWGRLCAVDPARVEAELVEPKQEGERAPGRSAELEALRQEAQATVPVEGETGRLLLDRLDDLAAFQDVAYARDYLKVVGQVWQAEAQFPDRGGRLTAAVVRQLFKLMAYKDEYEVARLLTHPRAGQRVRDMFDGPVQVANHLHPPSLRRLGLGKVRLGPAWRPLLRLLARCKGLRGTAWDPFGRTSCRRLERELVDWYGAVLQTGLAQLRPETYDLVVEMATATDKIRGYEQVKENNAARVRQQVEGLLQKLARS